MTRIGIENSIWSLLGCGSMQEKFSKEFVITTCFFFFVCFAFLRAYI